MSTVSHRRLTDLVDRLRSDVGDALVTVGVAWTPNRVERFYVRVGPDSVADHLDDVAGSGAVSAGLDGRPRREAGGPRVSGHLYDEALLTVAWHRDWPVAVVTDPAAGHFEDVVACLRDALR